MHKIQMVDLTTQYERIRTEAEAAMHRVIREAAFIKGPDVQAFEQALADWCGSGHVISCANGTDALQIAMMALDLRPGDEVITANFTYVATAEVIALLGLKPVLVEADPHTFNILPEAVEAAITARTRAIVPVHLFGQCADMAAILAIAQKHGLYVIEDNAQAIGARYTFGDGTVRQAGTMGHFGATSFFPSKNLGCFGDGGALFTQDPELARKARMIANHGQEQKYIHDIVGINSRLDTLQAAILRIKLRHLDEYILRRQAAAAFYTRSLAGIAGLDVPHTAPFTTHVFHQYTLQVHDRRRDALKARLHEAGIPSMIYYPLPLHHQKAYAHDQWQDRDFPTTTRLCDSVLSLPMHTELDEEQLSYICQTIQHFFHG